MTDNGIELIAQAIEKEVWFYSENVENQEERDQNERDIYNELLRIKEL